MKIEVDVSKKRFFVLLGVILLIGSGIFVYALAVDESKPWHDAGQVKLIDGRSVEDAIVSLGSSSGGGTVSSGGECVKILDVLQSNSQKGYTTSKIPNECMGGRMCDVIIEVASATSNAKFTTFFPFRQESSGRIISFLNGVGSNGVIGQNGDKGFTILGNLLVGSSGSFSLYDDLDYWQNDAASCGMAGDNFCLLTSSGGYKDIKVHVCY